MAPSKTPKPLDPAPAPEAPPRRIRQPTEVVDELSGLQRLRDEAVNRVAAAQMELNMSLAARDRIDHLIHNSVSDLAPVEDAEPKAEVPQP